MYKIILFFIFSLYLSSCSSLFYQPDRYMYFPPELNGYHQQNIYFASGMGTDSAARLHAWFFQGEKSIPPKGTIIQFHGNAENISSHYASLVWLVHEGYNLFTFDYRGYGESFGEPDQESVIRDGEAALKQAWELHQKSGSKKLIVYAQSLGGAIAMKSLEKFEHSSDLNLVVLDSTFMSYHDVAQETLAKIWFTWPLSPLGRVLVSDRFSTEEEVKKIKARLLVIHDEKDPVVKFENGEKIFKLAQAKEKDFWKMNRGQHVGVFFDSEVENRKKFLKLLESL